uniref:Uncharacterized protein n=1 Tax=Panagrolaimus sp. ES5 TaxID=591445 RepID=A0AC34F8G1_9BILA
MAKNFTEYAPVNEKAKETIKALIESNTIEDQQEIISTYFNWIYNNHYKYVKSSCFSLLQYLNVSVKENQVDKEQSIFLSKVIVEAFEYELNEANQNEKDHILKQQVSSSLWNKIYNFFHYEIYKTNVFVTIIFKTDKPNLMKKYEKMLNSINYNEPRICQIPSSITEASLIHSKSFEGHEELEEKLLNLDCKFVIFLKQEEGASMEVFLSGKWHQVKNPSGNFCTPAYISFKKEKLEIGETALNVYKKNPEFVLFDMLRLLGRSYDQISPQPSWRFSIAENPRNPNSVVYEVETWQGRRAITPEFAFGIFLKALRRLAEKVSKQPQPHVAIFVPAFYEMAHKDSLKVACSLAGLFITDSIQYPQNDVLVFQNKATDFGVLAEQASSK